MKIKNL